jgi:flagellar hook-associated protein 2
MAGIIGSSMDVPTIVNELMKRQTTQLTRISRDEKLQEIKLSLYGQLKSSAENINTALEALNKAFQTISFTSSVGNASILSASIATNSNVFAGTHQLDITSIAAAKTIGSKNPSNTRDQALNMSGDLTFTIGSSDFTVNVTGTDSLDMIRDKINIATNNVGVTAGIVAGTDIGGNPTYSLVIASNKSGVANAVNVTGSLAATFDFTNAISEAKDAVFTLDGNNVVRSTNTITDVLDGVSFTLLAAGQSSFTITQDDTNKNKAIADALQGVVDAYNKTMDFIDQNVADRNLTDSTVNMVRLRIQNLFASTLSNVGGFTNINELGIKTAVGVSKTTASGSSYVAGNRLEINADLLNKVLATGSDKLQKFFTDTSGGFNKVVSAGIHSITDFGGVIPSTTQSINESISIINRSLDKEEKRLELMKAELTTKYSALSAMMDKFDRLSSMLEKTFSSMSIGGKK